MPPGTFTSTVPFSGIAFTSRPRTGGGSGGAAVLTVNDARAGLGSVFPATSVANTSNVCGPSASGADGTTVGPGQCANASASKRHMKVAVGSVAWNVIGGAESEITPDGGESSSVSGGVESST